MKCVIAAVMLASLAVSHAAPSAWPWGWPAVAPAITQISSVPAAHYYGAPAVSWAQHVAVPQVWGHPAAVVAAPHAVVAAPQVVAAHAPLVVGPAASYTAANRGSVHQAPLPGHAVSQTSLNLAPAPGTL